MRFFLFIYYNDYQQSNLSNDGGRNRPQANPKLIFYQSDPQDELKLILKQNCNRIQEIEIIFGEWEDNWPPDLHDRDTNNFRED